MVMKIVDSFFGRLKRILDEREMAFKVAVAKEREFRRWHRRHPLRSITASFEERSEVKTRLEKRSVNAFLAGLSVMSLVTQITSSVYFGVKLSSLTNFVIDIQRQVESDWATVKSVANNVRVVKNEEREIAIRLDSIYGSLMRLKEQNSCDALRTTANFQLAALENHFQMLYVDIVTAKLTPRVLSFDTTMQIHGKTSLFDENLMSVNAEYLYKFSAVSLHSINPEKRILNLLLAYPRVKSLPTYRKINMLSPSTSLKIGNQFYSQYLQFDSDSYAIPLDVQNQKGFSLHNMTKEQIKSIKVATGCGQIATFDFCKNFIPAGIHFENCLEGLLQGTAQADWCTVKTSRQRSHLRFHLAHGKGGTSVTSVSDISIYGKKYPSDGGKRLGQPHLLTHHKKEANHTSCIYIPATYASLINKDGDETTEVQLQGSMTLHVYPFQVYDTRHFTWIKNEFQSWLEPEVQNMTVLDREFKLESMERQVVPIRSMESMTSPMFLLAVASMAMSLITVVTVVCLMKGSSCRRSRVPESDVARKMPLVSSFRRWSRGRSARRAEGGSTLNLREPSVQCSTTSGATGGGTAIILPLTAPANVPAGPAAAQAQAAAQAAAAAATVAQAQAAAQAAAQTQASAPIYLTIAGAQGGVPAPEIFKQPPHNIQTGTV